MSSQARRRSHAPKTAPVTRRANVGSGTKVALVVVGGLVVVPLALFGITAWITKRRADKIFTDHGELPPPPTAPPPWQQT